jgi:hypothetical protein
VDQGLGGVVLRDYRSECRPAALSGGGKKLLKLIVNGTHSLAAFIRMRRVAHAIVWMGVLGLGLAACGAARPRVPAAKLRITGAKLPMRLKVSATAAPVPKGLIELARPIAVAPAGPLAAPAKLHFRLARRVPTGEAVVVRSSESPRGPWRYLPTRLSASRRALIVETSHFSIFEPLAIDLKDVLSTFKTDFIDGLGDGLTQSIAKPVCQGDAQARSAGYTISSSTTDTVYWCLGMTGSQALITVVDHRRYPLEIAHPGFGVYRTSRVDKLEAASLSHIGSGAASILASGDSITYEADLQPGRRAIIQTQFDGLGQSLEAIQVGAQALTDILTRFGAGSGRKAVDNFAKLLSIRSCADALGQGSGALISGCFDPKDMLEAFGAKGLLLAPVMAIGGVVAFLHGEWNALTDQFNNHDKYTIVLTRAAPSPPPTTTTAPPPTTTTALPPTTTNAPPPTSTAPAESGSAPTCDQFEAMDGQQKIQAIEQMQAQYHDTTGVRLALVSVSAFCTIYPEKRIDGVYNGAY